jgi:hypothetical protein
VSALDERAPPGRTSLAATMAPTNDDERKRRLAKAEFFDTPDTARLRLPVPKTTTAKLYAAAVASR